MLTAALSQVGGFDEIQCCAAGPRCSPRGCVLSMKEGHVSNACSSLAATSSRFGDSSIAHLSMAPSPAMSWVGAAPVAQFSSGPSCGQGRRGACRSKGLVAGQHLPDGLGQPASDVDRGDLCPPLPAELGALALEDGAVERMAVGGVRRLDERPAQVVGPVLAQGPAPVALARLLDPRAEP